MKNPVVILSGATGTGKTGLAIELGRRPGGEHVLPIEIINFDSLLFFRELSIGTARPSLEDMKGIPHHLIGMVSIEEEFSAFDFVSLGKTTIASIHKRKALPVLVGGSGFYLRALIKGMWESKTVDKAVRRRVQDIYNREGIEGIQAVLRERDPDYVASIHPNDRYRLIRGVEHLLQTGTKLSTKKQEGPANPYDFSIHPHQDWNILHLHLEIKKEKHGELIRKRAQNMLEKGLLDEVEQLLKNGFSGEEKALRSIGYKESIEYLKGKISDREELLDRIVISTRQLAKSQRTFFKKISPKQVFCPLSEKEALYSFLVEMLTIKGELMWPKNL